MSDKQKVYDAENQVRVLLKTGGEALVYGSRVTLPVERDHGPAFREIYSQLVETMIGAEAAWVLRVGWQEAGLAVKC
jgi:CMP-2-keto-3-deoxyoctulosonic acid synthetase